MKAPSCICWMLMIILAISCNSNDKTGAIESKVNETGVVGDPLSSWNDGAVKQAIIAFVKNAVDSSSKDFIPVKDRIACFDNDGTLWSEQPMYFQAFFLFDRVKTMAPQHPEWKNQEPFKSVLTGDIREALAGGEKSLGQLFVATHANVTDEEFSQMVTEWVNKSRHPKTQKPFTEMVYQPMLELMSYLRVNGFQTFIVSGGGIDFMRPWAERVYGIPPNQVVGSSLKAKYEVKDGKPIIMKTGELNFIDDGPGKPVGIYQHIGKRPVFTVGNSDGDYQMLQWTATGTGPRFGMIIHHTDSTREWAYDRGSHIGKLEKGLDDAAKYNWRIVDMKKDWNRIYPN
jgi:phosphoglycolate phosphatase-like HAD superfamily hydrolase